MPSSIEKAVYEPVNDSDDCEINLNQIVQLSYEKSYRRLRVINIFLVFAVALAVLYAAYLHLHLHDDAPSLGTDPFGFVPADIGEPRQWMTFGVEDPYYIPYDIFDDVERVERLVENLLELDHPGLLTHGQKTSYMGVDNKLRELTPTTAYRNNMTEEFPVYFTRAFHQMHCIILFTDAYGHILHGKESRWDPEHIAHCVNVLRESVACLADASVASFTYKEDRHIARDQKLYCRNYMALRKWADDPTKAARYDIVENLLPENLEKHKSTEKRGI